MSITSPRPDLPRDAPSNYAYEKRGMLRARWDGASSSSGDRRVGDAIRRFSPTVFPGIPPQAVICQTLNAMSPTENTTEGSASQSFHEIGIFQVPAGPRSGPAPNPSASAADNAWARLATSQKVRNLLGRNAVMGENQWKTAIDDQVAVGLWNLREDGESVVAGLPVDARPARTDSDYFLRLCSMGFSKGSGGAVAVVRPYAAVLAQVNEANKWRTLRCAIAADALRGIGGTGKGGRAHGIIRADQKFEAGPWLMSQVGGDPTFFTGRLLPGDSVVEEVITRYYLGLGGLPSSLPVCGTVQDPDSWSMAPLFGAILLGASAFAGYWWWTHRAGMGTR